MAATAVFSTTTSVSAFLLNRSLGSAAASRPSSLSVVGMTGLPALDKRCTVCYAQKQEEIVRAKENSQNCMVSLGGAAPLMAVAAALTVSTKEAFALVDERLSTEGTGLGLGLSNPLLGWILVGVFTLIWILYFTTYSNVKEDEDSGLSL
uniref:PSII 6.1 kDa protein n=1 Tax=Picea sitchensis TaxID=3332 RepID=C0PQQ7_PICSI|nr:unknown [Picea sitchensis]ACN40418.1 unknown [Picea sitchensis]